MEITFIPENVQKKLFQRIQAMNREGINFSPLEPASDGVTDQSVSAMMAKACWARVVSAVVDPESETGELVRLSSAFNSDGQGGFNPANSPITSQDQFFTNSAEATFRPHSGVTGITTSFKSHTIQTVTINWKLWDINQFEKYRNAFLHHSRIVTVEFGWSVPSVFQDRIDIATVDGMASIYRNQRNIIKSVGGDYYVTTGKIVNFSYTVGQGGELECTTELTAMANDMFAGQVSDEPDSSPVKIKSDDSDIATAMKVASNTFANYMKSLTENIASAYDSGESRVFSVNGRSWCSWGWFEDRVLNTYFSFANDFAAGMETVDGNFNPNLLMYIKSKHYNRGETEEHNLCRYHSDIATQIIDIYLPGNTINLPPVSVDADADGKSDFESMPGPVKANYDQLRLYLDGLKNAFSNSPFKDPSSDNGRIRNFVFSAEFLKRIWGEGISSIESGLNSHWGTVTSQYGGFWDFEARSEETDPSRIGVYDKNKAGTPDLSDANSNKNLSIKSDPSIEKFDGAFEFSVYGRNSMMKNFSINVEISSRMATMAAFHTNKSTEDSSQMAGPDQIAIKAMSELNSYQIPQDSPGSTPEKVDTTDKVLEKLYSPYMKDKYVYNAGDGDSYQLRDITDDSLKFMADPTSGDDTRKIEKELAQLQEGERLSKEATDKNYWFKKTKSNDVDVIIYDQDGNMLDIYTKTMNGKINGNLIDPATGKATLPSLPIPIKVSFTIPGIAGLSPFDIFEIDYLPQIYKESTVFQVMTIGHSISTSGWETTVEGIMRLNNIADIIDEKNSVVGTDTILPADNNSWLTQVNKYEEEGAPDTEPPEDEGFFSRWNPFK